MLKVCDVAHNASLHELTRESRFPIQCTQNLKSSSVTRVRLTSKKGFVAVVCLFLFVFVLFVVFMLLFLFFCCCFVLLLLLMLLLLLFWCGDGYYFCVCFVVVVCLFSHRQIIIIVSYRNLLLNRPSSSCDLRVRHQELGLGVKRQVTHQEVCCYGSSRSHCCSPVL